MIYSYDRRNTKKLKNQKLKCWVFTNNSLILVKLFKKKPKYWHIFLWKNPKIPILFWVLVFSFTYLVLVYPMDSTKLAKNLTGLVSNLRFISFGIDFWFQWALQFMIYHFRTVSEQWVNLGIPDVLVVKCVD